MSRRFAPQQLPDDLDPALLDALAGLGDVRRDPGRRAAGRAAVMVAAARARESAVGSRGSRWRRRVAAAAFGVAGAQIALGGVVAMAAGAQPDSPLYGIKRAAEEVRLSLTFDPVDKARLELELASRRVDEAVAMAHSGHAELALTAARDATSLVEEASAALSANPSVANEQALEHASSDARGRLEQVFAALENSSDPGAAQAARSLDHAWQEGLGGAAKGGNGGTSPGAAGDQGGHAGAAGSGGPPSSLPSPAAGHATGHPGGRGGH
jgi:hypothetical protein